MDVKTSEVRTLENSEASAATLLKGICLIDRELEELVTPRYENLQSEVS